jgi:hypothetical protein
MTQPVDILIPLRLLADSARTGEALKLDLGLTDAQFEGLARHLWRDGLIQGRLSAGCCSAPCGLACVSAMKMAATWQLSKKGRLRLKVLEALG